MFFLLWKKDLAQSLLSHLAISAIKIRRLASWSWRSQKKKQTIVKIKESTRNLATPERKETWRRPLNPAVFRILYLFIFLLKQAS